MFGYQFYQYELKILERPEQMNKIKARYFAIFSALIIASIVAGWCGYRYLNRESEYQYVERQDGFMITVASEIMAVLCLSKDIEDLKTRIGNIIIGIIGANIGGFVASRFGLGQGDGINLTSILIAAGGAVILLALLRLIRGKQ